MADKEEKDRQNTDSEEGYRKKLPITNSVHCSSSNSKKGPKVPTMTRPFVTIPLAIQEVIVVKTKIK